jgi:serine protease AprX
MDPKTRYRLELAILAIFVVFLLVGIYYLFPNLIKVDPPDRADWAYDITEVDELHEAGFYGEGVVVGIIDTGIDLGHEAMGNIELVAWKDLVNHKTDPYDDDGHGTSVASLIASEKFGVAPECKLIVVKAISNSGSGSESDIVDGIDYCKIKGADVISLSLGRQQMRREDLAQPWRVGETDLQIACENAINAGIFLVGAADNDGEHDDGDVGVPSIYDDVIAVGAIDENKKIAPFSSAGDNDGLLPNWEDRYDTSDPDKKPELVAPGVGITSPSIDDSYVISEGTSVAVPFVTGIIAIILGEMPQYQHENNTGVDAVNHLKTTFMNTADELPGQTTPHDDHYGYGLIQGYEAFVALE